MNIGKIISNPIFRKGVENIVKGGVKAFSTLWSYCSRSK